MLYNIVLAPLWPSFTEAYAIKDFTWMRSIYKKMIKIFALTAFIIMVMVLVSPWVYDIWLRDKLEIPLAMTISIGVYTLINAWDLLQVTMINGIGRIKLQMYLTLAGTIVHIPLSFFIGSYVGALGVVYSMSIVVFVYSLFFTIQIRKIISNKATGIWIK
jgi:O-antigen/teichoic acid export membrane protein